MILLTKMLNVNKIHCIKALNGLKELADKSVDLVVTDPPYFIENLVKNVT